MLFFLFNLHNSCNVIKHFKRHFKVEFKVEFTHFKITIPYFEVNAMLPKNELIYILHSQILCSELFVAVSIQ